MTLLLFLLILSVLVFVHEFGHFWAAKKAGIYVEEFGFGLPPRIWGKKIGETIYSINALPIGGFVKLYGEDGEQNTHDTQHEKRAFFEKSILRRLSVLLAGVFMNLLLAIISFSVLYFALGIPTKTGRVIIDGIAENSPAKEASLKPGDQVITVAGEKITSVDQFIKLTKEKSGAAIQLEVVREKDNPCESKNGNKVLGGGATTQASFTCREGNLLITMIPRLNPPAGEGPLGVAISDVELKKYPFWQMPYLGMREGFKDSLAWGGMILGSLGKMVATLFQGQVPKDVAGPIGIFQITGQVAKEGYLAVLQFLGILSVNLAIINILPLPALDGGRLWFLGYELIFKKRANPKIEGMVNTIGMAILLSLMLLITINDVLRVIKR